MKRVLGKISQEIIYKWHLDDYKDKNIVFYPDRKEHCEDHKSQYANEEDYYYVMANL